MHNDYSQQETFLKYRNDYCDIFIGRCAAASTRTSRWIGEVQNTIVIFVWSAISKLRIASTSHNRKNQDKLEEMQSRSMKFTYIHLRSIKFFYLKVNQTIAKSKRIYLTRIEFLHDFYTIWWKELVRRAKNMPPKCKEAGECQNVLKYLY